MNIIGSVFVIIGAFFIMLASFGILKFNDLLLQMHASTKAGTLGAGLVLLGVGLQLYHLYSLIEIFLLIFFIALTTPITAHLIAKTAYENNDIELDPNTLIEKTRSND